MNKETCLNLLREIKDVSFATVDEFGNPQVRIIDIMYEDGKTLYFLTARGKNFYQELINSNKVAITAMTKDYQSIRVEAKIKKITNKKEWLNKIFTENPSMKNVYPKKSRKILEVFCLEEGEIEFFDLSKEPIYRESFSLNDGKITEKGFIISDECIECGTCFDLCPQEIIAEETPYKIQQHHCLHCGLCFENCPSTAIYKK